MQQSKFGLSLVDKLAEALVTNPRGKLLTPTERRVERGRRIVTEQQRAKKAQGGARD